MRIAPLALLLLVTLSGCPADDPYPWRPPGGGSGSNQPGIDAGDTDDDAGLIDAAVADQLDGVVCVILDVAVPFECPAGTAKDNVDVAAVNSGTSAISDTDGLFTIDLTTVPDTLRLGAGVSDGLVTTLSRSNLSAEPVTSPVLDEGLRDSIYANLTEVQTTGAMLIYVVDSAGPVAGATVTGASGRLYYDDGAGAFVDDAAGTGNDGIALIVDTDSATVTATEGIRTGNTQIATATGAFGVGVIMLPDP
jgi:hypothetical protein